MFYISLPFFYQNQKFNNFFKEYVNEENRSKKSKLIARFNIEYAYGSFPWSFWNGGINTHTGRAVLAPEMQSFIINTNIPIRFDVSNINLQETDYFDLHENAILKAANGTNSYYEISDLGIINYISNYNLNNKYIISNNAQLIHPFTEDIINVFTEQQMIELVDIGYNFNLDLSLINNKNKLEVCIGHCGNCSLEQQLNCSSNEQQKIYDYSGESLFINCPHEKKISNYYNELVPFLRQGIQHFKIITKSSDLNDFNITVIKSFVQPEYVGECIDEYYKAIAR